MIMISPFQSEFKFFHGKVLDQAEYLVSINCQG